MLFHLVPLRLLYSNIHFMLKSSMFAFILLQCWFKTSYSLFKQNGSTLSKHSRLVFHEKSQLLYYFIIHMHFKMSEDPTEQKYFLSSSGGEIAFGLLQVLTACVITFAGWHFFIMSSVWVLSRTCLSSLNVGFVSQALYMYREEVSITQCFSGHDITPSMKVVVRDLLKRHFVQFLFLFS